MINNDKRVNRRNLLKTSGVTLAAVLAGCTGDSTDAGNTDTAGDDTDAAGDDTDAGGGSPRTTNQSPPSRVKPYMDKLPDYYPDDYWKIIDGAMDEGSLSTYTSWFGAYAEDMFNQFRTKFNFLDVEFVTLGTAETYQRASSEASRGLWNWDATFTWDPVLIRQLYDNNLAQTYIGPEVSESGAFSEDDKMGVDGQVRSVINLCQNGYNPEYFDDAGREVPRTVEDFIAALQDEPDFWTNFWGMNDGVTTTTAWQLMDYYTQAYSEEKMREHWEIMAEYDPLTFNTDAVYGELVNNGELAFGFGNSHWTLSKLVYPNYPEKVRYTDYILGTVQFPGWAVAKEASNPNAAKLLADWWYSKDAAVRMAETWHQIPARQDLDPSDVPDDRFWDTSLEINSIKENLDYLDTAFAPFEQRANRSQEANKYKTMWYNIFS